MLSRSSGVVYWQHLEDSLTLLLALEGRETQLYGESCSLIGGLMSPVT